MDVAGSAPPGLWLWVGLLVLHALLKVWLTAGVELGKDEAAYWYWSRHLDATYALLPLSAIGLADRLLPGHDWALRLGVELCGLASICLLYRLGRACGLERSRCLWAAAAFASSHWVWHTTSYLHPDAFLVTCWLACLVWARQAVDDPRPALYARMGTAAGLAVLSKYSAAFLALGLFLWILVTARGAERWRRALFAGLPFLAVAAPLIHAQVSTGLALPFALGTLSRIVADRQVGWRLAALALNPLLFVSPLLLWLFYRALASGLLRLARRPRAAELLAVTPAVCLLSAFGYSALVLGQVKGNWVLPAFLGLWPQAFGRAHLPRRPTPFLAILLVTGLLPSVAFGLALKYPSLVERARRSMGAEGLGASYGRLVSPEDQRREISRTWSQRVCEYHGWRALAGDLEGALRAEAVPVSVPLLASQYGIAFGLARYDASGRGFYTVDDPRFQFVADFSEGSQPGLQDRVLFMGSRDTPPPAWLTALYPRVVPLPTLARAAPGCDGVDYDLAVLSR